MSLTDALRGGFLRGKRTYLIGFVMTLSALTEWAVGDASLADLLARLPDILEGLGLMTLRASVNPRQGIPRDAAG